jgi:hypothetical protein
MATVNGDRSKAHALVMEGSDNDNSGSSSDHPRTKSTEQQQEQRREPSPRHSLVHNRIGDGYDLCDTIEARCHA